MRTLAKIPPMMKEATTLQMPMNLRRKIKRENNTAIAKPTSGWNP
jgi:hypothetical protein